MEGLVKLYKSETASEKSPSESEAYYSAGFIRCSLKEEEIEMEKKKKEK